MFKFQVGDIVYDITSPKSSDKHGPFQVMANLIEQRVSHCYHTENPALSAFIDAGNQEDFVSREVLQSPLYQALKEDNE